MNKLMKLIISDVSLMSNNCYKLLIDRLVNDVRLRLFFFCQRHVSPLLYEKGTGLAAG